MPIRVPLEAGFPERKMAFSMHLGAGVRTGDSGASMSVSQRNSRSDSALFCKNHGHMREYREYFLRSRVLNNSRSPQRGGKPHGRRLG